MYSVINFFNFKDATSFMKAMDNRLMVSHTIKPAWNQVITFKKSPPGWRLDVFPQIHKQCPQYHKESYPCQTAISRRFWAHGDGYDRDSYVRDFFKNRYSGMPDSKKRKY